MTLPSFSKFGLGVRSEEKNSDNIIAEKYDARLHGQNNQFSGASDWQTGYQNLRKVNYFFHNYKVPEAQENEDVLSLKGRLTFTCLLAFRFIEEIRFYSGNGCFLG